MVQQALKNNGSEIGDLMKLAHNSLYLWDQWTLCYERMLHMTPRTFSVNTGAIVCLLWMLCYACCSVLPAYFSGVSLWKSLALVQRPIALLVQKVVISKITLCVSFNTLTMAKPIPIRPLVQRLKRLSSVIHHEPAFIGGWTWFSPQRMVQTEVKEDPPEHLSISKSHILSPPS